MVDLRTGTANLRLCIRAKYKLYCVIEKCCYLCAQLHQNHATQLIISTSNTLHRDALGQNAKFTL